MDLIPPASILLILLTLYLFSFSCLPPFPTTILSNKSILLLISHPDDEAMFFAPTLLALTKPELQNRVKVICLSSGNSEGIGGIRKKELVQSCRCLGIFGKKNDEDSKEKEEKVKIIDREELQDDMEAWWDEGLISNILGQETTGTDSSSIDVIITFDKHGISSHKNHISAWKGARLYLHNTYRQNGKGPQLYTLATVPLWRKYIGYLDLIFTTMFTSSDLEEEEQREKENIGNQNGWPKRLVIQSNPKDFRNARRAMSNAHKSQMRWFRYGWIWGSRYMVLNELVREDVEMETVGGGMGDRKDEKLEL